MDLSVISTCKVKQLIWIKYSMSEKTQKLTGNYCKKNTETINFSVFPCTVWGIRTPDFQDENLASWAC